MFSAHGSTDRTFISAFWNYNNFLSDSNIVGEKFTELSENGEPTTKLKTWLIIMRCPVSLSPITLTKLPI